MDGAFKDVTGAAFMMPEAAMESMKPPAAAAIKERLSFMETRFVGLFKDSSYLLAIMVVSGSNSLAAAGG